MRSKLFLKQTTCTQLIDHSREMMTSLYILLFLSLKLTVLFLLRPAAAAATNTTCPLDFSTLDELLKNSNPKSYDRRTQCQFIKQGLRLVQSAHLRSTSLFLPSLSSSSDCWSDYDSLISSYIPNFDARTGCGFQTSWISEGCMNITTRAEFEGNVSAKSLNDVVLACNQSLENGSPCASCTTTLSSLQATYLTGVSIGNLSDCTAYPSIYAAAFANYLGPSDRGTAECLFSLKFNAKSSMSKTRKALIIVLALVCFLGLILGFIGLWFFRRKRLRESRYRSKALERENGLNSGLDSISGSTTLVKFTFDEIKQATQKFSRENIIGRGGYGNVYKGILRDGSEVAFKRFKNCSIAGDASFTHEVEVIASVRHVNLVALRGYCTATTPLEGHQRIIVCDLMKNGSLHDHLFGSREQKLSWPLRQKIALGTARGLAYLHYGAQPSIIHRDIKANNILLDDNFEARVADFGLAKFTPEGLTHLSTRVAGTMGYVAPEYALYGQLTERSDVYSFGVVFLELLSGKKALLALSEEQPALLTDWAWDLVRNGKALDVIEDGMPNLGPSEVMEKYVLLAVLCSHPQLYARPTMDQVVKILDMDIPVPNIPDRPISLISNREDIERSMSSSGSGYLSSSTGYQSYMFENTPTTPRIEEGGHEGTR